ncbi:nucleotidyltransferase [Enterococcus mundtii]|uniref:nucleotidyltransferase n=1 Tax=Enterococcus TaxID=1350 RepID=UPI0011595FD6|nr:nucleotidyltransferase [Enterococcus mundtii]
MKVCGIIVEYNPFHNGHLYHVQQARERTGADVVIAVMSGNFLQRGEPAILDKWQRAEVALQNGVDLVVELPIEWAVQSADYFAKGAVQLLQKLNCDYLCFGTEDEATFDYQAFGQFVLHHQDQITKAFQELPDQTMSYPQKMTQVFKHVYPEISLDFSSPNHILGLSYAKENATYEHPMELVPINRKGAGYHDEDLSEETIASATAIRKALTESRSISATVPSETERFLKTESLQTWTSYWPLLKYRLLSSTVDSLQKIYQMTEGLEIRMLEAAKTANTFYEFVEQVKTKRYTWTRIQRLSCYVLLNIQKEEMREQQMQEYIHVLGFTTAGRACLKNKKTLALFAKIGKKEAQVAKLLVRSDQIYRLGGEVAEQVFGRKPVFIETIEEKKSFT